MKLFGRYLGYRLEKTAIRTFVFTVISVIISWVVINSEIDPIDNYGVYNIERASTGIGILAFVLGVACTLIPILEHSEFKNRRNLDTLYFFPIKREKMALVHFLSGFIQVFIIYTATFISAYINLSMNTNFFALEYLPLYYLLSVLIGFMMYSIFAFLFMQGNTLADGIIFCLIWICFFWYVGLSLDKFAYRFVTDNGELHNLFVISRRLESCGTIYSPITGLTRIFKRLIEVNKSYYTQISFRQMDIFFVWGGIGLAAAVGYFISFIKRGAEKTGEISTSWFGYRLLVPIYGYGLLLLFSEAVVWDIIILTAMLICYIIYRRGFKFKPSDIAVLVFALFAATIGPI